MGHTFLMLKDLHLICVCLQMQHHGNPSTSSSNSSMAEEQGGTTDGTEDESIPWMLQQHAGMETTAESSTEEICRWELDNYLESVWRPIGHEKRMSAEEWWQKREYLWNRVGTIARRHLATQASSACSERSF